MTRRALTLQLAAASWMPADAPEVERIAKLAPFFEPRPGQTLTIDSRERRDHDAKVDPTRLRGEIKIAPPRGRCFTIQRAPEQPDSLVCKPAVLTFTLTDLDHTGRLRWLVKTEAGDFGTELVWPTPYRVAIVTPFDQTLDDPPTYKFIASCRAERSSALGRRITLEVFGGERWTVTFPEADQLLPQPEPPANLMVLSNFGKLSVKDAASPPSSEGAPAGGGEAAPPPDQTSGQGQDGAKPPGASAPLGQVPDTEIPDPARTGVPTLSHLDRKLWSIPLLHAYGMNASHFKPLGAVPPGMQGSCRYTYQGPPEDPRTGRLECHEVDGYRTVYIPLTCLGELRGG